MNTIQGYISKYSIHTTLLLTRELLMIPQHATLDKGQRSATFWLLNYFLELTVLRANLFPKQNKKTQC